MKNLQTFFQRTVVPNLARVLVELFWKKGGRRWDNFDHKDFAQFFGQHAFLAAVSWNLANFGRNFSFWIQKHLSKSVCSLLYQIKDVCDPTVTIFGFLVTAGNSSIRQREKSNFRETNGGLSQRVFISESIRNIRLNFSQTPQKVLKSFLTKETFRRDQSFFGGKKVILGVQHAELVLLSCVNPSYKLLLALCMQYNIIMSQFKWKHFYNRLGVWLESVRSDSYRLVFLFCSNDFVNASEHLFFVRQ